jgi:hypothetical protein
MIGPLAESYMCLLQFEIVLTFGSLRSLHERVRQLKPRVPSHSRAITVEELRNAMDLACVFYPKRVLCLQRSAATTILMRRHGIHAEMVIGAQMLPFKSHAWVEVDGAVVNDRLYVNEIYTQLERC